MTKRRPHTYYVLTQDVIIPKGTVLGVAPNELGGVGHVTTCVDLGKNFTADFVVQVDKDAMKSGYFEAFSYRNHIGKTESFKTLVENFEAGIYPRLLDVTFLREHTNSRVGYRVRFSVDGDSPYADT